MLREGWILLGRLNIRAARENFQLAHREYQQQPILHALTHFSLAATYVHAPKKYMKEVFLGICAPYATQREKRRNNFNQKKGGRKS